MSLAPSFAGSFYPDSRAEIEESLQQWWDSGVTPAPSARALLVPHAGWFYSGAAAARAFASAQSAAPRTVVLMGPSHSVRIDGACAFDVSEFETPLGPIETDSDLLAQLVDAVDGLEFGRAFAEHSIEVQLPMLRHAWPEAKIVAITFGSADLACSASLARALAALPAGEVLLVASTDLSHYHDHDACMALDLRFRDRLLALDPEAMIDDLLDGKVEACGVGPTLCFMELARACNAKVEVVHQCDSSAADGETMRVVGYLSALALQGAQ